MRQRERHILKQTYDTIIVGTGPGGVTVARELTLRGGKILMIERGGFGPITGSTLNALPMIASPGRGLLFTPELYGVGRG